MSTGRATPLAMRAALVHAAAVTSTHEPWRPALARLLADQSGVVTRQQVQGLGARPHDLKRLVRHRDLVPYTPGVFVDHTGEPTWLQRAWAAVLRLEPAALYGVSALRAADGPGRRGADERVVHVAIDRARSVPRAVVEGERVHFVTRLDETVQWHLGPPRRRYEDAVLDAATDARDDLEAIAVLTRAVGSRATTADRLAAALAQRPRARRRRWLVRVLADARSGTHSVLEHGYLTRVERPHGLPSARRQRRASTPTGVVYRDAVYPGTAEDDVDGGAYVELDGSFDHAAPERRDADLERDLDSAAAGKVTVRLGFRQVFGRPCATTAKVVSFLHRRGVEVDPHPCGPGCPVTSPRS